jgi:hypothetical protein
MSQSFFLIYFSVWKVLRGPNNDWPLALCDYQSVDMENDTILSDVLHERSIGENVILYKNPQHAWYYLSDQDEDDLIIFRNVNSKHQHPGKSRIPGLRAT